MTTRVSRLQASLAEKNVDAIIISNPENRRYITGFTGSAGSPIITGDRALFFTDFRYVDQAKQQCPGFEVRKHTHPETEVWAEALREMGVKRLGFEKQAVYFSGYEDMRDSLGVELVPLGNIVGELREVKDDDELDAIRKAVRLADDAFNHILTFIKPGLTETDVALELEFYMRRAGAEGLSFGIIVASGQRSALPHGRASARVLEEGDLVTMDFGCVVDGYCSDLTRTIGLGTLDRRQQKIYDIVLESQRRALAGLRPGMTGIEGDALAREYIAEKGYGDDFGHGLGHGVGLAVHEGPSLSTRNKKALVPGNVVTVEPGIYISGWGGVRIEDMVVVTEDGIENMTGAPKELIIL